MRLVLFLLVVAVSVLAGNIKGVVLEHASGRPLARTVVRLNPVPQSVGATGQPLVMRAGRAGQFEFGPLSPGAYLLHAVRNGYFPGAYGQRVPTGRGTPIEVTDTSTLFAELRLRHKGAITGQVLDENGVGMAGIRVLAYPARLPLRSVGNAESDDRGIFRVSGLDPGKYWVRSAPQILDDGSRWLPTYGSQGRDLSEALTHTVAPDLDTKDADINLRPGPLFRLGGLLQCDTPGPVIVTLSSETGRQVTETGCAGEYRFEGLASGDYEVFATLGDGSAAGFIEISVARDMDAASVPVQQLPTVHIEVRQAGSDEPSDIPVKLTGRREDLSEIEPEREITESRTALAPGHWQFRALAPSGQYVESIVQLYGRARRPSKAKHDSDWFEVFIAPRVHSRLRITVSDQAGQIAGRVTAKSRPVPGAPVFLWAVADSARRSLSSRQLQLISDTDGGFRFHSLPPGDYRLLASFDVNEVDTELMELSKAVSAQVEALQTTSIELPVWVAPW